MSFANEDDESVDDGLKAIRMLMHSRLAPAQDEILELTEDDLYDEQQDEHFIPSITQAQSIKKNNHLINENLTKVNQAIKDSPSHEDGIITLEDATKSIEALKQLIKRLEKTTAKLVKPKTITVEEVVKDTIKPYLKDWLSQYLQAIVQGAVDAEVEKLVIKKESANE